MANEITCTWAVNNMEHEVSNGFVVNIDWSCTAEGGGKSAFYGGQTRFELKPDEPGFIPYDQLTQDIVLSWVFAELGDKKAEIEADRTSKVEKQLTPIVEQGLPWKNPTNP